MSANTTNRHRPIFMLLAAFLLSGWALGEQSATPADGWAQFRGPGRSGVSKESGLTRTWPENGPPILWRQELGEGFSGISVAGDDLYTLYAVGDEELAGSFSAADGSPRWSVKIGSKYLDEWGNGPRATPTIDGEVAYVLGSAGRLLALDVADGGLLWEVNLVATFGPSRGRFNMEGMIPDYEETNTSEFGHCSSPLIVDDVLIAYTGAGNGKSLVALDKHTGRTRWSVLDAGSAHSSPALMEIAGQRQIVQVMPQEIAAVSPSGEVLWQFPWVQFNISQPVFVAPSMIFASTGNDVGAVLIEVADQDSGFNVEPRWRQRQMRNSWGSSVFHGGHIYGFDNATLKCLDAESAEVRWAKRGLGKGSLIVGDGLLIVLSDQGMLAVAEATPEEYRELGRMKVLEGPTWTAPSLSRGKLFLRNHRGMVCIDLVR
ncbi:MAG TPA: PQQ-binding-like beta-propeller repeat protein [Thermoanaerobaculia bacterium]